MDAWIERMTVVVKMLLGAPSTPLEFWSKLVPPILIAIVVLFKVSEACGAKQSGVPRSAISLVLGLVLIIVGLTLTGMYVMPRLSGAVARWCIPGMVILISVVLIAPFMCLNHRMMYVGSLITWGVAIGVIYALITLTGAAFNMAGSMGKDAGAAQQRKQALEEFINLQR